MKNNIDIESSSAITHRESTDENLPDKNGATEADNTVVDIRELKRNRSNAKRALTKKRNEIKELMTDENNALDINKILQDLETALGKFIDAHKILHENLHDEEDIEESKDYLNVELERIANLKRSVNEWNERCSYQADVHDVRPEDSVSNVGSHRQSSIRSTSKHSKAGSKVSVASSGASSISFSRAKASAKRARLQAQAASIRRKRALEEEQFRLRKIAEEIELETQLAMAKAEENVFLEAEKVESSTCKKPLQYSDQMEIVSTQNKFKNSVPRADTNVKSTPQAQIPSTTVNNESGDALTKENFEDSPKQKDENDQFERFLQNQQRNVNALMLPKPEVPVFGGDPIEYQPFVTAFENLIEANTDSESSRLYYLIQYTRGDVKELMKSCLSMKGKDGYKEARKLLKHRYGQSYKIAASYVDRVTNGPSIKPEDTAGLQRFSTLLTSCKNMLGTIGYSSKLENPDSLRKIIDRLPYNLRRNWRDVVDNITQRESREININDIATFVEAKARASSHPIFGNLSNEARENKREDSRARKRDENPRKNFAINSEESFSHDHKKPTLKCPSCDDNHWLSQCPQFKKMSLTERFKLVRKKGLCDNCLTRGHLARKCPKQSFCKVHDCKERHSTYLHEVTKSKNDVTKEQLQRKTEEKESENNAQNCYVDSNMNSKDERKLSSPVIGLAIVPVKVKAVGSDRIVETYAFLDDGSNTSFCSEDLMKRLNVKGKKTTLSLTTMEKTNSKTESSVVSLELSNLNGEHPVVVETVFSTTNLPVSNKNLATQEDVDRWIHLAGIEIDRVDEDIGLLIGCDAPEILEPIDIRRSRDGGPYATKTIFGWVVNGPLGRDGDSQHTTNFVRTVDEKLECQFKEFCNLEFDDTEYHNGHTLSKEDQRALELMEGSVKLKQGHYEVGLPWKRNPPDLPNNRVLAERRLNLLKKRLDKDPKLLKNYTDYIQGILNNGYARKLPEQQLNKNDGKVWYLPHHPVFHPQKPDKTRVVFDCSAKFEGTSLNSELLQGPDLTNSLTGVLTRFRQSPVAFIADIEAMFHQVRAPLEDCDVLRFLWWPNGDTTVTPEEFQMMVHLFGGISSPSCANFALKKTAEDNRNEFDSETVNTLERNFYVDDCLKSVEDEESGIILVRNLRELLQKGGFRLTKWTSNSRNVLESLPESERAATVKDLDFNEIHVERALGVRWNITSDKFGYKIVVKDRPATRRGILSVVSSIYDPLGFVSPFVLVAKFILQDLCRSNLGWDERIPEEVLRRWQSWLEMLPKLEEILVDRCLKPPNFGEITSCELHTFSDASLKGYGAVTYSRLTNQQGDVHCCFLMGKSRLAPLKATTIPRLELSAAVTATRLDKMMNNELDIKVNESVFWTDSTCVLKYIANESTRFQTFVANRIAKIQDATETSQWRYVNTSFNPADDASRGLTADELLGTYRWLNGPEFLWKSREYWPSQDQLQAEISKSDPELKKKATTLATIIAVPTDEEEDNGDMSERFLKFSSWKSLKKSIAWVIRYIRRLQETAKRKKDGKATDVTNREQESALPLKLEELENAEKIIIRTVQRSAYRDEVAALKQPAKTTVNKSSPIYKLTPEIVDGLLCVGGRLRHAPIANTAKHQIILPKKHHVAKLIARHYHELSGHSGVEYVLSTIREKYWIVKGRLLIRSLVNDCFDCRRRQSPVAEQRMADLPKSRVTPSKPPFTYTGVDCFGPFNVRRGRSIVKRYGVIFTCFTIRAIHIEIASSLDTDSFINAMRRFVARRGNPEEIRSDNGSNFVSGEKELRKCIKDWNQTKIHQTLLLKNIKWIFNPPGASHHGGVWERCIRTVRKVMRAILCEQTLNDESLHTLMCEVEAIINGRPITKVSDDPRDGEALTPNHLLLLHAGPPLPPGKFMKEDLYSRRRWRQVQYMADVFWRRWMKEYLPSLQQREKWNHSRRNVKVGDIVLVLQESTPRCSWPLARVIEVYQNRSDKFVRSVKLKTATSVLVRPIAKIVVLEEAG